MVWKKDWWYTDKTKEPDTTHKTYYWGNMGQSIAALKTASGRGSGQDLIQSVFEYKFIN